MVATGKSAYDDSFDGNWATSALLVIICSSLAGFNALELLLLIFTTFNIYKGLYFWSLLVATTGIIPYMIGVQVVYFGFNATVVGWILSSCGWVCMVTGQSVVLYSRLSIVLGHGYEKLLAFVKWMIIVDGVIFHSITTVFTFGTHYAPDPTNFAKGYFYVEKLQMTVFCLQEFIISGIYMWKALDLIRTGERKQTHRVMVQLFVINSIIVMVDIGLLTLEYKNLFIAEIAFKMLCYSIKLKLEFAILNKLVEFTRDPALRRYSFFGDTRSIMDDAASSARAPSHTRLSKSGTSPTVVSDARPRWVYDIEKIDTIPVSPPMGSTSDNEEISNTGFHTDGHNFNSIAPQPRTRTRTEADLMYAEAMRVVSKCYSSRTINEIC